MARNNKIDMCGFPNCHLESEVIWLGNGVCTKHFRWICDNPIEKAYKKFEVNQEIIKQNVSSFNNEVNEEKSMLENLMTEMEEK